MADSSFVVDDILDAVSDVVDVLGCDTADGDAAVLGHVDAMLLNHGFALLDRESREGEHTDLRSDVRPVTLNLLLFQSAAESSAHVVHSLADNYELIEPLLAHLWVVEDGCSNSGTMLGWGRVVLPHDDLDL